MMDEEMLKLLSWHWKDKRNYQTKNWGIPLESSPKLRITIIYKFHNEGKISTKDKDKFLLAVIAKFLTLNLMEQSRQR